MSCSPSSLEVDTPRQSPATGANSFTERIEGDKLRVRSESFADHYSQARMFFQHFSAIMRMPNQANEAACFDASRLVSTAFEQNLIPDGVTIMVLTQAREELIRRTVESVKGAKRAIIHVYNATAPVWRRVVFGLSVPEVMQLVDKQVKLVKELTDALPGTQWGLEYSPEAFSMTELPVSLEACNTAIRAWDAGPGRKIILVEPDAQVGGARVGTFEQTALQFPRGIGVRARVTEEENRRGIRW